MARLPNITRSNPLSQFTSVAPAGGIMFSALAAGIEEAYDRVEPVAIEKMKNQGAAMGREAARRQIGAPVQPALASTSGDVEAFNRGLARTESGGSTTVVNDEGFSGKYQFGQPRLDDFNRANGTSYKTTDLVAGTPASERLTEQVQNWHVNDIDNRLGKYVGRTVKGQVMSANAIRAMAHLGGVGGAEKYITSGGTYDPSDSNGTSLSDYARTHGGIQGVGSTSGPITTIQKADGSFEARQYSPYAGPILQAHNVAANAAYAGEILNKAGTDLLSMSQNYLLDDEGFGQAAQDYIDQIVENVPEGMQEGMRTTLNDAVVKRQRGILEDKQADIRKRASNSNSALVDRYSDELADALASGDQEAAETARSNLDGVLQLRETLPGLSWTQEQSANVFIKAQKTADARSESARRARSSETKSALNTVIKAAKAGLNAEDESLIDDPAVQAEFPILAAEAAAFRTLRDQMPEFLEMTPGQQQAAVAQLRETEISEPWQIDLIGAMQSVASENAKAWKDDPIKRAAETQPNNPPPPLPALDPENPDGMVNALQRRREYANDLVENGYTDTRAFFSEGEADALEGMFSKDIPPEIRAATAAAIVAGFGEDAVQAFNEIDADPVTMFAGKMMAVGADPDVSAEMLRGQQMLDEGQVIVPPNSDRVEAFNTDTAVALSGVPDALNAQTELMAAAQAIYAARAKGVDPKSEAAKELMAQSIQAALGQSTNKRGEQTGGIQTVLGQPVLLPVGVVGNEVNQALTLALTGVPHGGGFINGMANGVATLVGDAMAPEDRTAFWERTGGQPMLSGAPIPERYVRSGNVRLVAAGGSRYRMEITSGSVVLDAEDKNGNVFFFDINNLIGVSP